MQIQNMKIDEIKPYANNPRDNDGGVDAVANSIKEFGWQQHNREMTIKAFKKFKEDKQLTIY